jgi:ATP-dependent DNA helicase RecG
VGPARAELLERLGVGTVGDLLRLLPRRWEDRRRLVTIAALADGESGTFVARVASSRALVAPRTRRRVFRAVLEDDTGSVAALWFHFRAAHLQALAAPGSLLLVHGTVAVRAGQRELLHPELEPLGPDGGRRGPAIRPVYPGTEGIPQATLRALVRRAVDAALPGIVDPLGAAARRRLGLPGLAESLAALHAPADDADPAALCGGATPWHRRLLFDELLALQVRLALRRESYARDGSRPAGAPREDLLAAFCRQVPFALTAAQRRACREILADLAAPRPMQRLLQGDVGSGKTVVAALAVLAATAAGGQAALLVPTELLAEQHHRTLGALAGALGVETALLTRGVDRGRRARALAGLADGSVRFVVGTHALLEDQVRFARLTLAVVDEQHRFGVRQRLRLRAKGAAPDLLVVSATPIPRTLALALYGDLDVSVVDELPPGRLPVRTRVVDDEAGRRAAWDVVRGELARGRRVYVVCPLAEQGDAEDTVAAARAAERLRAFLPGTGVGLAHGGLPPEQRSAALERFRTGATPVLVATTVVEVGLDVPEATVMLVQRAERFGLSQLHQLRGRVGRGADPAHCLLFAGPRLPAGARERLAVLERTTDGFAVAQADLELRGPGSLAGTRQAGLLELRLAGLAREPGLLDAARAEARRIVAADPGLERPAHAGLREAAGGGGDEGAAVGGG